MEKKFKKSSITPQSKLLDWFKANARKLPFRGTTDPYFIWISEVMLQQTRVSTVLESFKNFIIKFPNVFVLANSDIEEVLSAWKGLGYYTRAHNLHKGAKYVSEKLDGVFPKNLEEALLIPGVGEYTARAVISIAYNQPLAVLDGNVKRVISRLYLFEGEIQQSSSVKVLQKLATEFLHTENPSFHNQAMMELGALICLPKNPNCINCPIELDCQSRKNGREMLIPIKKKKQQKVNIGMNILLLKYDNKYILVKDKNRKFFKTIYALPYTLEGIEEEKSIFYDWFNFMNKPIYTEKISHSITIHDISIYIYFYPIKSEWLEKLKEKNIILSEWENLTEKFPSSIAKKIVDRLNLEKFNL